MNLSLTILSWNIQGEQIRDESILARQVDFISDHIELPAVVMLQAVNCEQTDNRDWDEGLNFLQERLGAIGLTHSVHSGDWAYELDRSTVQPHQDIRHTRCQLTASDLPLLRRPLSINVGTYQHRARKDFSTLFPEKILVAQVDSNRCDGLLSEQVLELWNVGIIFGSGAWGEEKINALESVGGRIEHLTTTTDHHLVVAGDFNGPRRELSETKIVAHGKNKPKYGRSSFYGAPFFYHPLGAAPQPMTFSKRWQLAEERIFDPAIDIGIRDAYWVAKDSPRLPSTEDHSHIVHNANPSHKRLDHVLVSKDIEVLRCRYLQRALEQGLSDHAPVVTLVRINS